MFEPDLEAGDVLLDLLHEGQMSRQFCQTFVRLDARRINDCRAGSDENRVELVALGTPQVYPRIGFDLDRLQDEHTKALLPQMPDHATLVASRGFDADARDADVDQVGGKPPPAAQCIVNLPAFDPAMHRDIELGFGRIDSSRQRANVCHLRRPCLVKRTKLFRQPSGSDEGAGAITLRSSHAAQGGLDPITSGLSRMPSAAGHSFRNTQTITGFAITRAGKGACSGLAFPRSWSAALPTSSAAQARCRR